MMRHLITATLLIIGTASAAAAQGSAMATVTATVQAAEQFTVTGVTDFGAVPSYAHTATIDPTNPGPTQSTARFSVGVGANVTFYLNFSCGILLISENGLGMMTFQPFLALGSDGQAQGDAQPIPPEYCGTIQIMPSPLPYEGHIWLGGTLTVGPDQPAGSYSGTFEISGFFEGG